MSKIRVGVIGVGHLGKIHAKLYKEVKNAELCGIYDANTAQLDEVAHALQVPKFESMEDLLRNVDAVNIVTPTVSHHQVAMAALRAGCHVFLEKPITRTEAEARELLDFAAKVNRTIQVGHIERFNPALQSLKSIDIRPVFIEVHRLASFNARGTDVAVILDLMIHDLDLILHLVKSKPIHVSASGVGVISSTVDIANARIEFENGCVANVTASRISVKKMRKMRIFQKDAYISLDFNDGNTELFYIPKEGGQELANEGLAYSLGQIDTGSEKKEIKYARISPQNSNPLLDELRAFTNAIENNLPPAVSAWDGLRALELANVILEKIESHKKEYQ